MLRHDALGYATPRFGMPCCATCTADAAATDTGCHADANANANATATHCFYGMFCHRFCFKGCIPVSLNRVTLVHAQLAMIVLFSVVI